MSWHPEIERALAELRADSEEQASDAAAALGWLVREEGPERLSEGRLQEFLWSVLPSKFLMPVDFQVEVAAALARALEVLGLPRYAEVCRDPRVEQILRAWERSDTAGIEATRRAFDSSSVEPPDAGDLRWGTIMGSWESRAMEELSAALELAAQTGEVRRTGRGSKEERRAFAWEWIGSPRPGFEPLSPYERVMGDGWIPGAAHGRPGGRSSSPWPRSSYPRWLRRMHPEPSCGDSSGCFGRSETAWPSRQPATSTAYS
jgi:hypothetical protein